MPAHWESICPVSDGVVVGRWFDAYCFAFVHAETLIRPICIGRMTELFVEIVVATADVAHRLDLRALLKHTQAGWCQITASVQSG